jgi:hypothetical protein
VQDECCSPPWVAFEGAAGKLMELAGQPSFEAPKKNGVVTIGGRLKK